MELTKIFGWILLVTGIVIIVWSLYASYNIFTGKTAIPEIFKLEVKAGQTPSGKTPTTPTELQKELEKALGEQLKNLIPVDTIPKLLNLAVWSMLVGILIFGGSQISGLGIKLLSK